MLYIDSIWEYIVNFLELALFIIFIYKKLRIRANYKHQAVLMFLFVSFQFAVLCTLNKMGISSYSTLMSSCVLDIGYAVLFYRDSIIRRIFWGFSYSIICLVAEQISFFIPVTLYKGASLELLLGGTLRKPYTMLYVECPESNPRSIDIAIYDDAFSEDYTRKTSISIDDIYAAIGTTE